jgi:hypothetical protein
MLSSRFRSARRRAQAHSPTKGRIVDSVTPAQQEQLPITLTEEELGKVGGGVSDDFAKF